MKSFPVIASIKSFDDVKTAFQRLRDYFTGEIGVGKVTVTQPPNGSTLTIVDGKELKVTETWELRSVQGSLHNLTLDDTKMVEVIIKGVKIKLAVLKD